MPVITRVANMSTTRRVDHRALDAALDLLLLLDLDRDAVEHGVEHAGGLAGLDHRDVEAAEHLRVRRHRLREQRARLDLLAHVVDHASPSAWSSVCCSRITSAVTTDRPASIIVANWREKTCSDFGVDLLLEHAPASSSPGRCP